MHRARFDIIPSDYTPVQRRKRAWSNNDVYIEDIAHSKKFRPKKRGTAQKGGSKIHCKHYTTIPEIIEILREYMNEYYAILDDSLTLEACRA